MDPYPVGVLCIWRMDIREKTRSCLASQQATIYTTC